VKVDFTIDEANALVNLLDLAVRHGGIRTAATALPLLQKLEQAAQFSPDHKKDVEQ